ncbi:MAG: hypothetical protein ACRC5M_00240 [Anaeroplasmataceae bacterium]
MVTVKKIDIYICSCGSEYSNMNDAMSCCCNSRILESLIFSHKKKFNREASSKFYGSTLSDKELFYKDKFDKLEQIMEDMAMDIRYKYPFLTPPYTKRINEIKKNMTITMNGISVGLSKVRAMIDNQKLQERMKLEALSKDELINMLMNKNKG